MGHKRERELREVTERLGGRALKLQAKEYERRLGELNGEAGRIREILASTLPREKFDDYISNQEQQTVLLREGIDEKIEAMSARISANTRTLQRLEGAVSLVRFLGVAGLVGVGIGLWNVFRPT